MIRGFHRAAAGLIQSGCRLAPALLRDRSGTPALEFALIAPVMFSILAGTYDVTQILIAMRQVTSAAQEIVQIATEQAVQPDQTISLTTQQAYQAQTAIYALMPRLKSGADTSQYSVTLSAIVFVATPPGCVVLNSCTYIANTAWSTALSLGLKVRRSCGVVTQVASTEPATVNNLPTWGMTTVTSVVIADVIYKYQPLFSGFITGPITFQRTSFLPPRAGKPTDYVKYDKDNVGRNPDICPGYI